MTGGPRRAIDVSIIGTGPRVVLVHGALTSGRPAWAAQQPLADSWTLVVPTRRGFHPNPPAAVCDYDVDATDIAPLLEDGAHLVGHSYGGLVAALIAARCPDRVRSLTLIEPALHGLALDHPAVQATIKDHARLRSLTDPAKFLPAFLTHVGAAPMPGPPRPLGAVTRQHALMAINERLPWTAVMSPPGIREAAVPVLLITNGSNPAFEAIADAVERRYVSVQRHTVTGAPHAVQILGDLVNRLLEGFWLGTTEFHQQISFDQQDTERV